MVYTFKDVKRLRYKKGREQDLTRSEKKGLKEYVERKEQVSKNTDQVWSHNQLMKAKRLLRKVETR